MSSSMQAVQRWRDGFAHEVRWWEKWIRSRGSEYPDEFARRLDPLRPFPDNFRALVPAGGGAVRVLDVGAGPLTSVGVSWPGHDLRITAVDPLADEYNRLLDEEGIVPPVRTIKGEGETLAEMFGEGVFDLAHSRNALDHSYDPVGVIGQMYRVVRPGGAVFLQHSINEGQTNAYKGLHQWNFCVEGGRFVVWNDAGRVDVLGSLGLREPAEIEVLSKNVVRWTLRKGA
jgi:SAM-dependent methyltransferase